MNMTINNIYTTAIIFRDGISKDYIHSMVAFENGQIRTDSLDRLSKYYHVTSPIYSHTFATREQGILAQRRANCILKMFYIARRGSIISTLPEDVIRHIYTLAETDDVDVLYEYVTVTKEYRHLIDEPCTDKGRVYVMKDTDPNGQIYYKIGMTKKSAELRLAELKAEAYLSSNAKCIYQHTYSNYINARMAEGFFHAKFFDKKMSSPYRGMSSNGYKRESLDECYVLTDQDLSYIVNKHRRT